MPTYSAAYIAHLSQGPFPGRLDPWAEAGRYFHQLHSELISQLLGQLREPLLAMGYIAGRETSLQIAEYRQPDLYIQRQMPSSAPAIPWNYAQAAAAASADPGLRLEGQEPDLDALHIKTLEGARLVTVVEVVSPRNKTETALIHEYQERRARLLHRGVNVVELDLTRSVKRLVQDALVDAYPYHLAIHLHDQPPRLIGVEFPAALPRAALPLRAEVVPIELHPAYTHAYQQTSLAGHIHTETAYRLDALPFPSLLPPQVQAALRQQAETWQAELHRLGELS